MQHLAGGCCKGHVGSVPFAVYQHHYLDNVAMVLQRPVMKNVHQRLLRKRD